MPAAVFTPDGTSASGRIRARLENAGQAFRANDNIAAFIEDGELEDLRDEVENRMQALLGELVIDTDNDHNPVVTERRVAKEFLAAVFAGRYRAAPPITRFPNVPRLNQLTIVGPTTVPNSCPHPPSPHMGKKPKKG